MKSTRGFATGIVIVICVWIVYFGAFAATVAVGYYAESIQAATGMGWLVGWISAKTYGPVIDKLFGRFLR